MLEEQPTQRYSPSFLFTAFILAVLALVFLITVAVGIVQAWPTIKNISPYIVIPLVIVACIMVLAVLAGVAYRQWQLAQLDIQAKADQLRRDNELHQATTLQLSRLQLPTDERGNRDAVLLPDNSLIVPPVGNYVAPVQPVPHTIHYAPPVAYRDSSTRVTEEASERQALPAPEVPTGRELLLSGRVTQSLEQGYYLLGPGDDGAWKRIHSKKLFSTLISGIPRVGKTTTVFWILTQVLLRGGRFFVVDPNMHYESEDGDRGLASELAELADFMIFPACEGAKQELLDRLRWMYRELQSRKQQGYIVKDSEAILAIMDEFNSIAQVLSPKTVVVVHEEEELNFAETLALLEREGPKYGLAFMLIGHKWTQQDIGGSNSVRTNATTYLCHKMNDERQANLLLSGNGKQILELPVGAYLATGPQFEARATKIYTPMISARDIPVILSLMYASRSRPDGGQMAAGSCPISSTEEKNGRDLDQPGQRADMTNEEDELPDDLRTKMRLVLQMDQQPGTSVNKIIKEVWGFEADTRQGRAAKEELNTIRALIAKRTLRALQ